MLEKEAMEFLQRCSFLSKSFRQDELLTKLQEMSSNFEMLKKYINSQYFMGRHIKLTICLYEKQPAFFCLYHPKIGEHERQIFILHFEVVRKEFTKLLKYVLNTFFKYFFNNDPSERIIFLRNKVLFDPTTSPFIKQSKYYYGQAKTPITSKYLEDISDIFVRRDVKCQR